MHQSTTPSLSQIIWPRWASKQFPNPPYSPDLAPCDFWLFPKLRGCRYETTEAIPDRVIGSEMVVDASLLNTQDYKVRIKGKVEQSREMGGILSYTLV